MIEWSDKLNEGIINNTAVKDALYNYLKVLIYTNKMILKIL